MWDCPHTKNPFFLNFDFNGYENWDLIIKNGIFSGKTRFLMTKQSEDVHWITSNQITTNSSRLEMHGWSNGYGYDFTPADAAFMQDDAGITMRYRTVTLQGVFHCTDSKNQRRAEKLRLTRELREQSIVHIAHSKAELSAQRMS